MSLATRCPVCATVFRVHRSQLGARAGRVRCGKCGAVFDGIGGLLEERVEALALEPSPQLGLFDPSRRPRPEATPPAKEPPRRVAEDEAPLPGFLADVPDRRGATLAWGLAAVLAAGALAAQVAYRYRTEIAVLAPATRPALEAACRLAGCQVPLPQRPDLMSIESSELKADPRRENVIALHAVIRNRAPFPQDYPALELTLTDDNERPVVRRVLAAGDYADAARIAAGIPASGEATLTLHFDASGAGATGYRLYLFFP